MHWETVLWLYLVTSSGWECFIHFVNGLYIMYMYKDYFGSKFCAHISVAKKFYTSKVKWALRKIYLLFYTTLIILSLYNYIFSTLGNCLKLPPASVKIARHDHVLNSWLPLSHCRASCWICSHFPTCARYRNTLPKCVVTQYTNTSQVLANTCFRVSWILPCGNFSLKKRNRWTRKMRW